jgi:hypothetical protein
LSAFGFMTPLATRPKLTSQCVPSPLLAKLDCLPPSNLLNPRILYPGNGHSDAPRYPGEHTLAIWRSIEVQQDKLTGILQGRNALLRILLEMVL